MKSEVKKHGIGIYLYRYMYIPIHTFEGGGDMSNWGGISDAQAIAQRRYDKKNTKGVYLKLNLKTDLDIIRWLYNQKSKQGAIKQLIRQEIARQKEMEEKGNENSDFC